MTGAQSHVKCSQHVASKPGQHWKGLCGKWLLACSSWAWRTDSFMGDMYQAVYDTCVDPLPEVSIGMERGLKTLPASSVFTLNFYPENKNVEFLNLPLLCR